MGDLESLVSALKEQINGSDYIRDTTAAAASDESLQALIKCMDQEQTTATEPPSVAIPAAAQLPSPQAAQLENSAHSKSLRDEHSSPIAE